MRCLKSLRPLLIATALACDLGSGAHAVPLPATTSITWTGDNNFNTDSMTFGAKGPFLSDEITGITGGGQFQGNKTTTFSLWLNESIGGKWKWVDVYDWSGKPANTLSSLGPISFNQALIDGIQLTSTDHPKGKFSPFEEEGDAFHFTNFYYTTLFKNSNFWGDGGGDKDKGDHHTTTFVFDNDGTLSPPGGQGGDPTPLPAALPLMGTVLGGGYLISRLRRWRKRAGAGDSI